MANRQIGLLHPGAMGAAVGAAARGNGHSVFWASEGRSQATKARATAHGLEDAGTLAALCARCDVILAICPPHAAEQVARAVIACGWRGLYVDANAISPERAVRVGKLLWARGAEFVDGGIIGGPPWTAGETVLSLAGRRAGEIAEVFAGGPLEVRVLGEEVGEASALKMCYAAWTKGTTALLAAILATAEELGVREFLYEQWARDDAKMPASTEGRVRRSSAKAWRFAGEMEEIAATFRGAGLPGGFHEAAAAVYERLAGFKDMEELPPLNSVLKALTLAPPERRDGA